MNISLRKGLSYGVTSGVITTLGLIIGLYFSTSSKDIIIAGILTIAFADSLSDGLGIYVSEESENEHTVGEIWESAISTVITKLIFTLSFVLPLAVFPLTSALIINMFWGFLLLSILSYYIARQNKKKLGPALAWHLGVGIVVIGCSFAIGKIITFLF